MDKTFRLIDANINRVAEGIRVLEDLSRFYYPNGELTKQLRELRHKVRKSVAGLVEEFLIERDAENDPGLVISRQSNLDDKATIRDVVTANWKRVQEGLRVIEENLKFKGYYDLSKIYEQCRYEAYTLEKRFLQIMNGAAGRRLPDTDLYCLTSEEHSRGRSNIEVVGEMIEAGIKIIQYREKDKKARQKYEECRKIREMTRSSGVTFIVNDDVDIAIIVGADGVHIGQDDLPVEKVRELVGDEMIIGVSTHSPEQAADAVHRGADYIGVGPLFATQTKKDVCAPVGLEYLDYVVKNIEIPFVAIGGIKENNIAEVAGRGAGCIAMVTEIVGAENIRGKIIAVRKALQDAGRKNNND